MAVLFLTGIEFFKDEPKLVDRGRNAMQSGHVETCNIELINNESLLKGIMHASMKNKTYNVQDTKMKSLKDAIHITITNATSPTAHTFLYHLAQGEVFGYEQPLILYLMDFRERLDQLRGVALELETAAMPLVSDIITTTSFDKGFQQSDFLVLMSPPVDFSEWPDPLEYLSSHAHIFKDHGLALELFGKRTAQVVVVGALALINAAVIAHFATSFPPERITCVTQLADLKVRSVLAAKFRVTVDRVTSVATWGCAGYGAQFVDTQFARVKLHDQEEPQSVEKLLRDDKWLRREFQKICDRQRMPPGIVSTAQATIDHMRYLLFGTPEDQVVGMGVATFGAYGVSPGLYCSLPVTVSNQRWKIVPRLTVLGCHEHELGLAATQLANELEVALSLVNNPRPTHVASSTSTAQSSQENDEWDGESDKSVDMYPENMMSGSSSQIAFSPVSLSFSIAGRESRRSSSSKRDSGKSTSSSKRDSVRSSSSSKRGSVKSIKKENDSTSILQEPVDAEVPEKKHAIDYRTISLDSVSFAEEFH